MFRGILFISIIISSFLTAILSAQNATNIIRTNGTLLLGETIMDDFDEGYVALDFNTCQFMYSSKEPGAQLLGDFFWDKHVKGISICGTDFSFAGVIDMGSIDLIKVTFAPRDGYSNCLDLKIGNVYCIRTKTYMYAKVKVVSLINGETRAVLQWVFQRNGTNKFEQ